MILGTYNPYCQASCPNCEGAQDMYNEGGNLAYHPRYLVLRCLRCEVRFKRFIGVGSYDVVLSAGQDVQGGILG